MTQQRLRLLLRRFRVGYMAEQEILQEIAATEAYVHAQQTGDEDAFLAELARIQTRIEKLAGMLNSYEDHEDLDLINPTRDLLRLMRFFKFKAKRPQP